MLFLGFTFYLERDAEAVSRGLVFGLGAAGVCIVIAILAACYLKWCVRQLPRYQISVDNDGLWQTEASKQRGLVPWNAICRIAPRLTKQRYDLLDENGKILAKLEFWLRGVEELRQMVVERAERCTKLPTLPFELALPLRHHIISFVAFCLFSAGGLVVCFMPYLFPGNLNVPLLRGILSVVLVPATFLLVREYLGKPYRLIITRAGLSVHFPLHFKEIPFSAIATLQSGNRGDVWVKTKNARSPIRISSFEIDPECLVRAIGGEIKSKMAIQEEEN